MLVESVSVALKVGVAPLTGLLKASRKIIETFEAATPFAVIFDVPLMLELAATIGPAVKTTVPSAFVNGEVMERVLVSAFVDLRVQVEIPEAFVAEQVP